VIAGFVGDAAIPPPQSLSGRQTLFVFRRNSAIRNRPKYPCFSTEQGNFIP